MSQTQYSLRCEKLVEKIKGICDAAIITSMPNMRYYSGFTGDSGLIIVAQDKKTLLTDFRYTEQAQSQAPDFEILEFSKGQMHTMAAKQLGGAKVIGVELDVMTVNGFKQFKEAIPLEYIDISKPADSVRAVKSREELDHLRKAGELTDRAFTHMLGYIKEGLSEIDIALELEFFMRKNGARDVSFDLIVAAGPNGSLPHAIPSERKVRQGDLITMDFGCRVEGYCSDMTRTVALGNVASELINVYNICLKAHKAAIAAVKPGIKAAQIDAVARDIIYSAGYEGRFGHGLGHGVGILVHEAPTLGPTSADVLEEGMIITVEPGIYLPGLGGVRIEDYGVVTSAGFESFVDSGKDLIAL